MKIAVLGWGSLVWNRGDLAIVSEFVPNGRHLPIEFCRISRGERLTLVIEENLGTPCMTYSAQSAFDDLEEARENLRVREGMNHINGVGFVDLVSDRQSSRAMERHPRAVETISSWVGTNGYDTAIWTALASNFDEPEKANAPFSVEAAIRYLETRDVAKLASALDYIRQAPAEVQTPVRAAVNARWPEG